MKKWVLKAIIQKMISFLPGSHRVNFWFQKYVTKGVRLDDAYFNDKLQHAEDHLRFFKAHQPKGSFNSLEIGTGWYPVVPICMYLAGSGQAVSIDLSPLMNLEGLRATIHKFQAWLKEGKLPQFEPYFLEERRQQLLKLDADQLDFESLLIAFNLEYRVGDARSLKDEKASFDLIHSNNVFEHIYPQTLEAILMEFKRVLKPEGLMSHFIDMSDHFAHLDSSISIYNFLGYSEKAWARIDNEVQPQNRWRLGDYEELYQRLHFKITEKEFRPGEVEELARVKLDLAFQNREPKDLAISHAHLVNTI